MNEQYLQLTGEKDAHITKTETTIREGESEIQQLRDALTRFVMTSDTCKFHIFVRKRAMDSFFFFLTCSLQV